MHAYRTHNCAELRASDVGSTVRLSGWIHRKRDHGGVLFVDLRDHYGLTQVVCAANSEALKTLDHLRPESVVIIDPTAPPTAVFTTSLNSEFSMIPVTLNFKLEREIVNNLNFYFGVGAGVAFTDFDADVNFFSGPVAFSEDDEVFYACFLPRDQRVAALVERLRGEAG